MRTVNNTSMKTGPVPGACCPMSWGKIAFAK